MIWKNYLWELKYDEMIYQDTSNWYEVYSWPALEVGEALTLVVL